MPDRTVRRLIPCADVPAEKRAVIYARRSYADQDPLSIERQVECGRKRIDALGFTLGAIYVDAGKTGTTDTPREGYDALMRDARERAFGAVVVDRIFRLHRRPSAALLMHAELVELGIEMHDADGQVFEHWVPEQAKAARVLHTKCPKLCRESRSAAVRFGILRARLAREHTLDPHPAGEHSFDRTAPVMAGGRTRATSPEEESSR